MESDSCTVMGQFKFLSRQDGVLAISQSLWNSNFPGTAKVWLLGMAKFT